MEQNQSLTPTVKRPRPAPKRSRRRLIPLLVVPIVLLIVIASVAITVFRSGTMLVFVSGRNQPTRLAIGSTATATPLSPTTPYPTWTPVPPTATSVPPTATPIPPTATPIPRPPPPTPTPVTYYGASLNGMQVATGVSPNGAIAVNAPWPQASGNYCSLADVQAVINYYDWTTNQSLAFPHQQSQGPVTNSVLPGNPTLEQPGQLLYALDHSVAANFSPGPVIESTGFARRPFTLANISHDFGLDPRAIAAGIMYGTQGAVPYHMHIYHTGVNAAAFHIAFAVATYHHPVVVIVDHGEHAVIVAGVWSVGNPATNAHAQIQSFAIYDPWNQNWQEYLGGGYFERVPYATFAFQQPNDGTWIALPYASNDTLDPDPYMGKYQAGIDPYKGPTANPQAHFWLGNLVTIEPDNHFDQNPDNAYNELDELMGGP